MENCGVSDKGLIDLAYRSGEVSTISAQTVYAHDTFEFELGLEPKLIHRPCMTGDRGDPIAFYAIYKTKDGGYGFEVMSIEDARKHAERFSDAYKRGFSPWQTNFEEMAKKTVLKKALKYAPLKTDFQRELSVDETVHNSISDDMLAAPAEIIDAETGEVLATSDSQPDEAESLAADAAIAAQQQG